MSECRLLLVDENPESREIISEALVDQGYLVSTAAHGDEAVRIFADVHPSLALVHVRRSGAEKLAALRLLREYAPDFPILVMGGDRDARLAGEQVGAAGYVVDPLDLSALVASVEQICPLLDE